MQFTIVALSMAALAAAAPWETTSSTWGATSSTWGSSPTSTPAPSPTTTPTTSPTGTTCSSGSTVACCQAGSGLSGVLGALCVALDVVGSCGTADVFCCQNNQLGLININAECFQI